jgi:hypothetical protein
LRQERNLNPWTTVNKNRHDVSKRSY